LNTIQELAAHYGVSKQQADLSGFCQIDFGILHKYIESVNSQLHMMFPEFINTVWVQFSVPEQSTGISCGLNQVFEPIQCFPYVWIAPV
jgi:hypothetical protein